MSQEPSQLKIGETHSKKPVILTVILLIAAAVISFFGTKEQGLVVSSAPANFSAAPKDAPFVMPQTAKEKEELLARGRMLSGQQCSGCHAQERRLVGPSYNEIAIKYETDHRGSTAGSGNVFARLDELARAVNHDQSMHADLSLSAAGFAPGPKLALPSSDRNALAYWILNSSAGLQEKTR